MTNATIFRGVMLDARSAYCEPDLADALGLSASTLSRARRAGELRYIRRGRSVIYLGADVAHWLGAQAAPLPGEADGG